MSWQKRSFRENNLEINMACNICAEEINIGRDDLIFLTIHKDATNGVAYKISFTDAVKDRNKVHTYVVSGSGPNDLKVSKKDCAEAKSDVPNNDVKFEKGKQELTNFYKDTDAAVQSVDKVESCQLDDDVVLVCHCKTAAGDKVRTLVFDTKTQSVDVPDQF